MNGCDVAVDFQSENGNDPPYSTHPTVISRTMAVGVFRALFAHSLLTLAVDGTRYAPHIGFSYFVPLNSYVPDGIFWVCWFSPSKHIQELRDPVLVIHRVFLILCP